VTLGLIENLPTDEKGKYVSVIWVLSQNAYLIAHVIDCHLLQMCWIRASAHLRDKKRMYPIST
jgi:hypothetical protein